MENRWFDRISDYLDGALSADETRVFEARMAEDPELARAVADVRALVGEAATLEPIAPRRDLWPEIAGRLTARTAPVIDLREERERRRNWTVPFGGWRALAAALALMVISGGIGWLLRGPSVPANPGGTIVAESDPATDPTMDARPRGPVTDAVNASFDEEQQLLSESIADLERLLVERGHLLDEDTRAIVIDNLVRIDEAIREARSALGEVPENDYLRAHLARSMKQKVRLLEDATRLTRGDI